MSSEQYFNCTHDKVKFFNISQQYRNESWDYHASLEEEEAEELPVCLKLLHI
jgi:hypothetical protein